MRQAAALEILAAAKRESVGGPPSTISSAVSGADTLVAGQAGKNIHVYSIHFAAVNGATPGEIQVRMGTTIMYSVFVPANGTINHTIPFAMPWRLTTVASDLTVNRTATFGSCRVTVQFMQK